MNIFFLRNTLFFQEAPFIYLRWAQRACMRWCPPHPVLQRMAQPSQVLTLPPRLHSSFCLDCSPLPPQPAKGSRPSRQSSCGASSVKPSRSLPQGAVHTLVQPVALHTSCHCLPPLGYLCMLRPSWRLRRALCCGLPACVQGLGRKRWPWPCPCREVADWPPACYGPLLPPHPHRAVWI